MQYILTEEEMTALREAALNRAQAQTAVLQDLCTKVCDHMPVKGWHAKDKPTGKGPWGCILSTQMEWYCDLCPVSHECPYELKQWSK